MKTIAGYTNTVGGSHLDITINTMAVTQKRGKKISARYGIGKGNRELQPETPTNLTHTNTRLSLQSEIII